MKSNIQRLKRRAHPWIAVMLVVALGEFARAQNASIAGPEHKRREVLVSISDRRLAVLEDGQIVQIFPVSVGASVSPSPTGDFQIINRVANPTYYHPGVVIPPGADNPIGPRWLGLNRKGFGIHGTNEPRSIGRAASHGCIRMRNQDIRTFFTLVRVGDIVRIRSERDPEVARVFGGTTGIGAVAEVQTADVTQDGGGQ
jgi:lipoprotein-anchoring transpeptidase ErfK/SrfK